MVKRVPLSDLFRGAANGSIARRKTRTQGEACGAFAYVASPYVCFTALLGYKHTLFEQALLLEERLRNIGRFFLFLIDL